VRGEPDAGGDSKKRSTLTAASLGGGCRPSRAVNTQHEGRENEHTWPSVGRKEWIRKRCSNSVQWGRGCRGVRTQNRLGVGERAGESGEEPLAQQ
jgi:hypothetical protein